VMKGLQARQCQVRMEGDNHLCVERCTPGRYAPLSFVDNGEIRLQMESHGIVLFYDFSTQGGFMLCALFSPICAIMAWLRTGIWQLTLFGLVAPMLWLYGANYVIARVRVPGLLWQLCQDGPSAGTVNLR
ncbi:MAG: hypothetical protein ACRYHQ_04335, partial [Janthinobacterium lividum]